MMTRKTQGETMTIQPGGPAVETFTEEHESPGTGEIMTAIEGNTLTEGLARVQLRSLQFHEHNGRRISPAEIFDASPEVADALVRQGLAELAG